jgi:hypothetical protein
MPADLHAGESSGARLTGMDLRGVGDRFATSKLEPTSKLDLRAPADSMVGAGKATERHARAADAPSLPSLRRTSEEWTRPRLDEELPSIGANVSAVRPMSRAEQWATRFRREGLPIARLFETHSALVSLGLNQRGKPGIWLIQKFP